MSSLPPTSNAMVLSVKPRYTKLILSGSKTVELRKRVPRFGPGGLVILYETSPAKAIVGAFLLERVEVDDPDLLWERVASRSGLDWEDYKSYFLGSEQAVGLHIGVRWKLAEPLLLEDIRNAWPDFRPPQSYRYVQWSQKGVGINLSLNERLIGPLDISDRVE